ncbi:hypothetical protein [Desulforegula conservatrix]|uniref:hypothetical protein n=1 Tax=Desulforegula conservatrix TaxID=153026 RepID=UPI00041E96E5|nr:hypothetical protein [Desulforegula conservatrix]
MRIITRPDFDGLVCAVFLKAALGKDIPVLWVEPDAIRHCGLEVRQGDIIANLPWKSGCSVWFDHHVTNRIDEKFEGVYEIAPSAAGLIYTYYKDRFKTDFAELSAAADKIDSANLTVEEVLRPEDNSYLLLSMTIKNRAECEKHYWDRLCDLFLENGIDDVMKDWDVKARCDEVIRENSEYKEHLSKRTQIDQGVALTDFSDLMIAPQGNRFLVYALYPETHVAVKIRRDYHETDSVIVSVGHSIFNRTCNVNTGFLLSRFGGGGHRGAGACKMKISVLEKALFEIMNTLKENKAS